MNFITSRTVRPSQAGEVHDLDVTPVMNLLIILIPFLVSMAVFTRLAVISFELPSNVGSNSAGASAKPELKLTVVVAQSWCALTLGESMLDSLAISAAGVDRRDLSTRLQRHRYEAAKADEIIVAVRDNVAFEQVVRIMDTCKETGFVKIGLSNATENPGKGI